MMPGTGEFMQASLLLDLSVDAQLVPLPDPVGGLDMESVKLLVVQATEGAAELLANAIACHGIDATYQSQLLLEFSGSSRSPMVGSLQKRLKKPYVTSTPWT
jgi:hypothetical protein